MRQWFSPRTALWWLLVMLLLLGSLLLFPEFLYARPGGGHSYSGGSGGYTGGGGYSGNGEGSAELLFALFRLFLMLPYPIKIVAIIGLFIGFYLYHRRGQADGSSVNRYTQSSGHDVQRVNAIANANRTKQASLDQLTQYDSQFSEVLFLDFAHSLFHKLYTQLGTPKIRNVLPFVSPALQSMMAEVKQGQAARNEVVVGNLQISDVNISGDFQQLIVDFDANYSMIQHGKNYRHIVQERWLFVRNGKGETADPEAMRDLACPNCGAPNDFNDAGTCNYCNTLIKAGDMTWMVQKIVVQDHQHFRSETLGTYSPERGTNSPTLYDPFLTEKGTAFIQRHQLSAPAEYWATFEKNVVAQIFRAMYQAWSERDQWNRVRHLLSDRLFESNSFWIQLYQEQGYYNRLAQINIAKIDPVKITWDNYYEAITVRIYASSLDYTEDEQGRLIGGNKTTPRRFSEYWTFVRKIGVERPESQFDASTCPNCGAPADQMSDSAVCGYCGTKTNQGDFTWVLSNIAQDDSYQG